MEAPAPYQNGGTWYGIYSGSKNKEAAYAWVKTMTADKDYLVNGLAGQLGDFRHIYRLSSSVSKRGIRTSSQATSSISRASMTRQ